MTDTTAPPETPEDDFEEPILDIDTKQRRSTMTIDGKMYELRLMGEFGIAEQQQIKREIGDYDALWKKGELKKAEQTRLKMLLDHLFDKVLDAPKAVKAKLNDEVRQQVVLGFTIAPLAKAAALQAKMETETEAGVGSTSES